MGVTKQRPQYTGHIYKECKKAEMAEAKNVVEIKSEARQQRFVLWILNLNPEGSVGHTQGF